MKLFKMPATIDELNDFERRADNDDKMFDTVMLIMYALIFFVVVGIACSYVAEKLNIFNKQVQQSFVVSVH